ncbi:PP2C family protein-serine/threonine phosphatase [Herpetosiphon giganteus]|uniref:PP2C family protein-serine/threonine phosphatase n=1 Tax=Herpetosiphon giganteus TaxID=2029754 RepID=UPI00195C581F|nr:SpoIIE family protein phosphatase [Herpetosiphon giganteus]MBM7844779.1 sigma-B regulation protein RsbU (phosphoserine phosphatase) [Herpetosiphon giganteus]
MSQMEFLRRVPLFADLSLEGLQMLDGQARIRGLPADAWLFHQRDRGDACYVVVSGTLRLVLEQGSSEETTLGLLGVGAFFGELSLLEPDGTRAAGAIAVVQSEVLEIPIAAFETLLHTYPAIAYNMLRRVAAHVRRSDERRLEDLRHKNRLLTDAYTALEQAQAEALRRARAARELELGRELQRRLIPTSFPNVHGVVIAAATFPAYEMSGDFYEVRQLSEHMLSIVMADVCDKGAGAALVMALAKGLLLGMDQRDPLALVERFNQLIRTTNLDAAVITMVYAHLDLARRRFSYVRAGHDWPLHYRSKQGRVAMLEGGGMPVGITEEAFFEQMHIDLEPGDALVFYTDGLCDARNFAGDTYGRERLISAVQAYGRLPAHGLADAILGDVRAFQSGTPPIDDLTLLVVKLNPESS